ncbi:MAG: acetyl ornithine aminotransferase family protein [bacterium]
MAKVEETNWVKGPKNKKILELDRKYVAPCYTRSHYTVIEKGKGAVVQDVEGNEYLDFAAGIAVVASGHCHPSVVKAIKDQAEKLIHMSGTDFFYEAQVRLAERLAEIAPGGENKKVFFGNSGAEAVEACLKLARYHTRRFRFIAFHGAFHGRTMGALSLTGSKSVQRSRFGPLLPGVTHASYGYCYRCAFNLIYPGCDLACVDYIEKELFRTCVPPEDVAAIVVEPVQGEGGYVFPPDGYHQRLKALAEKYDILFIDDEVQAGMGRTGKMFAIEHWGVKPDMLAVAKGIASGMPLGACIARGSLMDWVPGSHASTFGGNPISCAAALTTIRLLEGGLVENSAKQGDHMLEEIEKMMDRHRLFGDVRGKGLMIGVEIVKDRKTRAYNTPARNAIIQEAFKRGLIILGCGPSVLRFMPPLVVTRKQIDDALTILDEAVSAVEERKSM